VEQDPAHPRPCARGTVSMWRPM